MHSKYSAKKKSIFLEVKNKKEKVLAWPSQKENQILVFGFPKISRTVGKG